MRCLMCGKKMREEGSLEDLLFSNDLLCSQCRSRWQRLDRHFRIDHIPALASWAYNEAFASTLLQFKECGDEALAEVFLYPMARQLRSRYAGWTLLPMPSSRSKQEQRGFFALGEIYRQLDLPLLECFEKTEDLDQTGRSYDQRLAMRSRIRLKEGIEIPRRIVLVDDVCTSGSTLRGALACLDRSKHRIRIHVCALASGRHSFR